jgi:hypothetical protein
VRWRTDGAGALMPNDPNHLGIAMTEEQVTQDLEARLRATEAVRDRARAAGQLEQYMEAYCRAESIEASLLSRPRPSSVS